MEEKTSLPQPPMSNTSLFGHIVSLAIDAESGDSSASTGPEPSTEEKAEAKDETQESSK